MLNQQMMHRIRAHVQFHVVTQLIFLITKQFILTRLYQSELIVITDIWPSLEKLRYRIVFEVTFFMKLQNT